MLSKDPPDIEVNYHNCFLFYTFPQQDCISTAQVTNNFEWNVFSVK